MNSEEYPVKLIIAGGRDFGIVNPDEPPYLQEYSPMVCDKAFRALDRLAGKLALGRPLDKTILVVQGEARGADKIGRRWAISRGLEFSSYPTNWKENGKAAGHIRNAEMADVGTHLVAFWDGKSKGTKNMIDTARKKGVKVAVIKYESQ